MSDVEELEDVLKRGARSQIALFLILSGGEPRTKEEIVEATGLSEFTVNREMSYLHVNHPDWFERVAPKTYRFKRVM